MYKKENILVLVKTYPNLSAKYNETVCVAGVNSDGEWRRLYPIRFRDLPYENQFKKFQWISVEIIKNTSHEKFRRRESHKVKDSSIELKEVVDTKNNWKLRNELLFKKFKLLNESLEELIRFRDATKGNCISLGMIKPKILDFVRTPKDKCRPWEKELIEGSQITLSEFFTGEKYQSPLEHIPYKFSYKFKCAGNPACKGHDVMCEDWELYQLYRTMRDKYGEEEGWIKTKEKYYDYMMERDTYFLWEQKANTTIS